jgi:hypothetical protein
LLLPCPRKKHLHDFEAGVLPTDPYSSSGEGVVGNDEFFYQSRAFGFIGMSIFCVAAN